MKYCIRLVLLLILAGGDMILSAQDTEICLSPEEIRLINLINDYRKILKLPEIPISFSLSLVARLHVDDLIKYKPDTGNCVYHSWSSNGKWKGCCYSLPKPDKKCMTEKPREITGYNGKGFEILFWESREASAEMAFASWKETSVANAMITNFKEWEEIEWKALGIALKEGFAVAWFGTAADTARYIKDCETGKWIGKEPPAKDETVTDKIIHNSGPRNASDDPEIIAKPTGRYHIIGATFTTIEQARSEKMKFIQKGFDDVKILLKEGKYRVSISDYETLVEARKIKASLITKYKSLWIMAFQ